MNEQERRAIVDRYLDELRKELSGVPSDRRRELLDDVRGHIEEAWSEAANHDQATLLNIFERLGEPGALAHEERERLGLTAVPERQGPGLLEVAAVGLTVLFWPVGVVLAWLSPRWSTADKAVATAIPLVGLALVLAASMVTYTSFTSASPKPAVVAVQQVEVGSPSQASEPDRVAARPTRLPQQMQEPSPRGNSGFADLVTRVAAIFGVVGAPITSGLYLALRMGPRPRMVALLLPAGTILLVLTAVAAALAPLAA